MFPSSRLNEIFEAKALEVPDAIAVVDSGRTVTYKELDNWADRVASHLKVRGVRPGDLVGLCIDRSVEMIVGLMAILKAGAAYVPIDPAYPAKRIQFLLADSAVSIVVTASRMPDCLHGWTGTKVYIDKPLQESMNGPEEVNEASGCADDIAYIIYTSGSTGTPKGVAVEHRNVVHLFEKTDAWFGFNSEDVWTVFHSLSFDFSVWEIWGALLYGGRLVIVPPALVGAPESFHALLVREKVTVLNQTPSAFRPLADTILKRNEALAFPLRFIIFGGESLPLEPIRSWFARFGDDRPALVNMYGITETTVHVTYKRLTSNLPAGHAASIGKPIPGYSIYLLGSDGNLVEDGTPGEIYVSGPGLARGYLNRPGLTAERFVAVPSIGGNERLYRSGDLAMKTPDGEYVYLGRVDDQIKLRGFRIEPGEIEACLMRHPRVSAVVALSHDYGDGDIRIHAYFVPKAAEASNEEFDVISGELATLATELPRHMTPFSYFAVPAIPLTTHGKVDRKALSLVASQAESIEPGIYSQPDERTTGTDELVPVIVGIWEEILKKRIQPGDDLFDIGGSSLALLRILTGVNNHYNIDLNGSELDGEATPAKMAECVLARANEKPKALGAISGV